ncbi:UNVERIFIED_CONTAM: movement protein [Sesamum latifolium]|uniref:Movement protein n=1 Tax=Sesamum latifolium TaxID=2727402 RepID=A0AAW2VE25_9LAMI
MTISNKTMERIMCQDSNLSPYDEFRIGGIGRVLNQIGLNQRRHHIIYKVSSGEFAIPMELTGNVMEMQLIPKEEILEELSKLREEVAVTMKWIHIGAIEDFKRKDLMKKGNRPYSITYRIAYALSNTHHSDLFLREEYIEIPRIFKKFAKVMTPDPIKIPRIGGVDLVIKDHPVLERTLSTRTEFSSRMSVVGYRGKEKELIKIFTPQEIRVDNVKLRCPGGWKKIQVVFDITERDNHFSCDDLYHLQQPVIGRYEGMLEIAGHEILVAGVAGKKNGSMTLGLNFLEDHKPWGRKGADILLGNNFIQTLAKYVQDNNRNLLIFTTNCGSEIQVLRRDKTFNRIMPINFRSKRGDFDAKLTHPKMQDKRKFGKALLSFRQQRLIESDSFYEESEKEIINLKELLQEIKSLDISEESRLSLENVKRLIQRNFSENPLAWWDRNKDRSNSESQEECKYEYVRYKPIQMNMNDKKDMQGIIKEHINLGIIEPGVSAYSSPDFLVRNHGEIKRGILIDEAGIELQDHIVEKIRNFSDVLKDKKHLQSFLGVVNFAGIFIKDLAKYRKDFRPLLKETESSKWKWEEIHTQRVRELK